MAILLKSLTWSTLLGVRKLQSDKGHATVFYHRRRGGRSHDGAFERLNRHGGYATVHLSLNDAEALGMILRPTNIDAYKSDPDRCTSRCDQL